MRNGIAAALFALSLAGCSSPPPLRSPPGSVKHIVLLKWKEDVTPAKEEGVMADFRGLQAKIPGILSIEEGRDISTENLQKGFVRAVIVTFADRAARDRYLTHPVHEEFKKRAIPEVADLLVLDFETSR